MNMKSFRVSIVMALFIFGLVLGALPAQAAPPSGSLAQADDPTAEPPAGPTATPEPSFRPILVLESYAIDPNPVVAGSNFNLRLRLHNGGHKDETDPMKGAFAFNVVVNFSSATFLPIGTGGVHAIPEIDAGNTEEIVQTFSAPSTLFGQTSAVQEVTVTYTDRAGTPYTEKYTVAVNLKGYSGGGSVGPTATPTSVVRPQLVISNYSTDVAVLQPGTEFTLKIETRNLGNGNARGVTMIMGGGSMSSTGETTPQPGGVDGGGGEFTNFAPLKSSNIQFIGDIGSGEAAQAEQPLVVNVTTNPGAFSVKFSFIYTDDKGNRYTDAQVITLLVFSLPMVDIGFYQDPGVLFVGQPGMLPVQVTNLSRKMAVLGNLAVTGPEGTQVMNGTILIGTLDTGGYTTLDAQVVPMQPGPLELTFTINYMDDFNQPRTITQTKTIEVMDAPVIEEPPINGGEMGEGGVIIDPGMLPQEPETFIQKVVRVLKGLVGLDGGVPQPVMNIDPGMFPVDGGKDPNGVIEVPAGGPARPIKGG